MKGENVLVKMKKEDFLVWRKKMNKNANISLNYSENIIEIEDCKKVKFLKNSWFVFYRD
jgi:hypothetical protein